MNSRTLSILGAAAIVVILGAWWLSASRTSSQTQAMALYPALKGKLDSVRTLNIFGAGDRLVVAVKRDGDRFVVEQRAGYAADAGKVRRLLMDLENAKLREEKTSNPDNYGTLGVQALSEAGATGTRLELADAAVNLIVGKHDAATRSTYVRRSEEKSSWLVDAELDVPADPKQWLQREVLDIAADRIADATVELAGEKRYSVAKAKRSSVNFDVDAIPKGRELNNVSAPNAVAQALAGLQLDDVRPSAELAGEKSAGKVVLRTFDGLVVECAGYRSGEAHWVMLKSSFDETLAKRFHEPDAKASKEDADKALQAALAKTRDEATTLDKKLTGWAFAIPAHKYDTLFKPVAQLLKPK